MQLLNGKMTVSRAMAAVLGLALLALAPMVVAADQPSGRNFNHMTTGFPLTGGHATAECATCHVGGTFKGTPRTCDGCHAMGRRVIATPKSARHIVTSDPCEVCHTNTVTFLGARYNHGAAAPGSCTTCHNGFVSTGRPGSHSATTYMLTKSCDQCHRTTAWLPASWNHNWSTGTCSTCHDTGSTVVRPSLTKAHPVHTVITGLTGFGPTLATCESCHQNYYSFASYRYDHAGVGDCLNCHTAANATASNNVIRPIPTDHQVALATLVAAPVTCLSCHNTGTGTWTVRMNHNALIAGGSPCTNCHLTGTTNFKGMSKKNYGHEGFRAGQDCTSCHGLNYSSWHR